MIHYMILYEPGDLIQLTLKIISYIQPILPKLYAQNLPPLE